MVTKNTSLEAIQIFNRNCMCKIPLINKSLKLIFRNNNEKLSQGHMKGQGMKTYQIAKLLILYLGFW